MGSKERRARYDRDVICGEGSDEVSFLKYLSLLFPQKPHRIINGHGGTPAHIIRVMRRMPQLGGYQKRTVLFDGDKGVQKVQQAETFAAKNPPIECIVAKQCLECELLKIMGAPNKILKKVKGNSKLAKQEFEQICDRSLSGEKKSYQVVLPKKLLLEKRSDSCWLSMVLNLFD